MGIMKRKASALFAMLAMWAFSTNVFAQVNTAESSLSNIEDWAMSWIPLAATVLIIVCALLWMANILRADWALRFVIGLITIGSASYLVGLFGLS